MNCEYDHNCENPATHVMNTKIGDFNVCTEHAHAAKDNPYVRYVEPLYKSVLDRISENIAVNSIDKCGTL